MKNSIMRGAEGEKCCFILGMLEFMAGHKAALALVCKQSPPLRLQTEQAFICPWFALLVLRLLNTTEISITFRIHNLWFYLKRTIYGNSKRLLSLLLKMMMVVEVVVLLLVVLIVLYMLVLVAAVVLYLLFLLVFFWLLLLVVCYLWLFLFVVVILS